MTKLKYHTHLEEMWTVGVSNMNWSRPESSVPASHWPGSRDPWLLIGQRRVTWPEYWLLIDCWLWTLTNTTFPHQESLCSTVCGGQLLQARCCMSHFLKEGFINCPIISLHLTLQEICIWADECVKHEIASPRYSINFNVWTCLLLLEQFEVTRQGYWGS